MDRLAEAGTSQALRSCPHDPEPSRHVVQALFAIGEVPSQGDREEEPLVAQANGDHGGALLVAHANCDREASRELLAALVPRVLAQATRVLADRSEAEDVTQEVFLWL